jgi:hypothetical protein
VSRLAAGLSAGIGVIGLTAALLAGRRFNQKLDALDRKLAEAQTNTRARSDLPAAVAELATRMGADGTNPARFVDIRQTGTMWFKPGGAPQHFNARQRIGTSSAGFVWRAVIGPLGAITVVDSFVTGRGLLEARLLGVVRVAREDGTAALNQGEALRYLAELPWNPDAILFDHSLDWAVDGPRTIRVATGREESRAEITFGLDETGLIETAGAALRTFSAGKKYPWRGRFWDYQDVRAAHPDAGRSRLGHRRRRLRLLAWQARKLARTSCPNRW